MYQYKAILKSTREVVAEGHTIEDVEKSVKTYRRGQKRNQHTSAHVGVEIIHVLRDKKEGADHSKEKLIKII
ncbi:unknown; predicted coding region [Mycoplasmopsis pulmonis]|uniref:Uncharacterized protein n=1 Tax=Mycoplasmopsis pulmonis (strain UAB CTIP) TaxID=272635 RepID=Q98R35_MYCPU|nr:hypothetical protein [Mycoplasmopsis pulmonis]MDZ7293142.1 hypothetical protein [Mycoplasmopsis pulmonis]CAC13348.1 unknown; predicted coding region [Mycoplasmopsis pulmonis]VEU67939.1 Uncharacterised protein [Mycoplasmopsis pulmonis]